MPAPFGSPGFLRQWSERVTRKPQNFYIHASANAEQRIGAMMNARWTSKPAPASNEA
jgi:hypothetical protein